MTELAVVYIACLAVIFAHLLGPAHRIGGLVGSVAFAGLFASGLALAISAL